MVDCARLKTGDILHCSGTRTLSKLIKLCTRSRFSHSALFIEIWGQPYVIDAQKDGVNVRPWDAWVKEFNYEFVVHRSSDLVVGKTLAQKALTKVGHTGYDFEGLLWRQPTKLLTGKWKEKGDTTDRMYCSEFVAWVYGAKDAYRMAPEDLYNWCLKNGFYEIR